jgi:hypothetical protein|tara:strand:+ start:1002 stop:1598 length:597 start_codon:yes stop_codon:yes gene_type:complete
MSEEKEVDFQLELLSMENEYFLRIDDITYKINLESNECCKKLLDLANFDLQKFIDNCLEKIDEDNNKGSSSGTTNGFLSIKSLKIKLIVPKENETYVEDIEEYINNKISEPSNTIINENNTGLSFFLIFLSIFFGISLIDIELEEIKSEFIKQNKNTKSLEEKEESADNSTPTPTIDECLQQIEEEEAEKQKAKSLSL